MENLEIRDLEELGLVIKWVHHYQFSKRERMAVLSAIATAQWVNDLGIIAMMPSTKDVMFSLRDRNWKGGITVSYEPPSWENEYDHLYIGYNQHGNQYRAMYCKWYEDGTYSCRIVEGPTL